MSFQKTFDVLLDDILTDYKNQIPEADTSKGSLIFIKSACMASALWGIYKHQEWISKQVFPDTAEAEYLEKWAWLYAIDRAAGESDNDLMKRILDRIQSPPAGGNKADYIRWATEVSNVKKAFCYPLAGGLGTVFVLIIADETVTDDEVPSLYDDRTGTNDAVLPSQLSDSGTDFQSAGIYPSGIEYTGVKKGDLVINTSTNATARVTVVDSGTLLTLDTDIFTSIDQGYTVRSLAEETKLYIEELQPVIAGEALSVIKPEIIKTIINMAVTGDNADRAQIDLDIKAYINALGPGETLYAAQLMSIAINNGAENVTLNEPTADVTPNEVYKIIRPETVTVG